MSGRRVARRIASAAKPEQCRRTGVSAATLATKVFDCLSQSYLMPGDGAGRWRRGSHGGGVTGAEVWHGRGGKRRIVSRGALRTTPFIVSPFVTNEWCCEVGS